MTMTMKKTHQWGLKQLFGASDGNRTRILTLARLRSTTELHLQLHYAFKKRLIIIAKQYQVAISKIKKVEVSKC